MKRNKNNRSVCKREEVGFIFDLKEESEDECLTERKRVPDHRSDVWNGFLPQRPPAHLTNTKYPRLSEVSEKESGDGVSQRGMEELYQRQCKQMKDIFVFNPAANHKHVSDSLLQSAVTQSNHHKWLASLKI